MQSPIAAMQRATYPRMPHPLASVQALRGFGFLGDTGLTQGITGVKAGVSAAGISTSIGAGVASAIGAGAAAGSVVPIIGTAIGAIVGLVASGVFNRKVDPEVGNFNNAMALAKAQGPAAVLNIQDKYLVLAGLFDLHPDQIKGNIPIYKKYGRMGEQKFVTDMCNLIQQAANQGIITANDTVQSVYDKVVAPWINGFGFGAMQDSNSDLITYLLLGLIGEYVSGQYKTRWYAVGGQFAFGNLAPFTLPSASAAVAPTQSGTPTPVTSVTAPAQPAVQPAVQPAQTSAVAIPSGFVLVGASNNLPAYQGPDGYFYSWSGTVMSPLTGVLQSASGTAQVSGGAIVPATQASTSLSTNTQAGVSPYASGVPDTGSYIPYSAPSVPIPAVASAPLAAGVGTGALPSWVSWGAVAAVVGLMVMTAHPAKGFNARTQGRRPARRARK